MKKSSLTLICPYHRKPKRIEVIGSVREDHKTWFVDYYSKKCGCGFRYRLEVTHSDKEVE